MIRLKPCENESAWVLLGYRSNLCHTESAGKRIVTGRVLAVNLVIRGMKVVISTQSPVYARSTIENVCRLRF